MHSTTVHQSPTPAPSRAHRPHRPHRRTVVIGAAALLVAAVALPAAILGGDAPDPTPATAPDPPPGTFAGAFELLADVQDGAPAAVPYLVRDRLVRPDGTSVRLPEVYDQLVPLGDQAIVVRSGSGGDRVLEVLDVTQPPGRTATSVERTVIEGSVEVDPDGDLAAWATPGGELELRWEGGGLSLGNQGGPVTVGAVTGEPPCAANSDDCRVYVNNVDRRMPRWVAPDGSVGEAAPDAQVVRDVHGDGLVAVQVETHPVGSCSQVFDAERGRVLWTTCMHSLLRFSPDGRYLLGSGPYLDGLGLNRLDVLDARTGDLVARFQVTGGFIAQEGWEDPTHPLVVVSSPDGWQLLRLGTDGSRERLIAPVAASTDPTAKLVTVPGT